MSWTALGPALVAGAYLLGSISFSLLIVRARSGFDLREHGSGNAGATNVLRLAGPGSAALVLVLDVAKGAVPVQVGRALDAPGAVVGAAAMAAVVGHVWPVFHGLRGGKGVATATGALGSLAWLPACLAAAVFLVVVAATRYVSAASVTAVVSFPLWLHLVARAGWSAAPPVWLTAGAAALAALVVFSHRDNLRRLAAGTEHRLGDAGTERRPA